MVEQGSLISAGHDSSLIYEGTIQRKHIYNRCEWLTLVN